MSAFIIERPLKNLGSKAIEDTIKKAICDLTKDEYEADIVTIDFEPHQHSFIDDEVEIKLRLKRKQDEFPKEK